MHDFKWSPSEKVIARRAFDQALDSELQQLVRETKDRAAAISEASELWQLERWLTERRREINRKYDYRYSVLPLVFAELMKRGRIAENDLHGLDPEKIEVILGMAARL
jgi:Photoprotection regulator fluorescence recovery protein